MHSEVQLLAQFRYLLRGFLHFSEAAATAVGLTPQQHQMLLQIAGMPPDESATVGYLAQRLVLRHHSVVELADRCETAGLLRREHLPDDRRFVTLRLSPRGEQVLQDLSQAHAQELYSLGPALVATLQALTCVVDTSRGEGTL